MTSAAIPPNPDDRAHVNGIHVTTVDRVGYLRLGLAGTLNPISYEMWCAIPDVMKGFEADPDVGAIVIEGVGKHFSAGANIKEFATHRSNADQTAHYNDAVSSAELAIQAVTKPTLAVIRGTCIGGGCEISLSCDLRLAESEARFGITPSRLGIIYPFTSTKTLIDVVGPANAKYLLFTADIIDAAAAAQIGLVNRVVPADQLEKEKQQLLRTLTQRSLQSIQGTKVMTDRILSGLTEPDHEMRELSAAASDSADYRARARAFVEKRATNQQPMTAGQN